MGGALLACYGWRVTPGGGHCGTGADGSGRDVVAPPGPDDPPTAHGPHVNTVSSRCRMCCIARTTAAKALRVLVDEGVAEVSPGMGTYVTRRG